VWLVLSLKMEMGSSHWGGIRESNQGVGFRNRKLANVFGN
jgi:hypothetical protein